MVFLHKILKLVAALFFAAKNPLQDMLIHTVHTLKDMLIMIKTVTGIQHTLKFLQTLHDKGK